MAIVNIRTDSAWVPLPCSSLCGDGLVWCPLGACECPSGWWETEIQHFKTFFFKNPLLPSCGHTVQETYLYAPPAFSLHVQPGLELLCGHDLHVHALQTCGGLKHRHCQKKINPSDDVNCIPNLALHFKLWQDDLQYYLNTINPQKRYSSSGVLPPLLFPPRALKEFCGHEHQVIVPETCAGLTHQGC